MRGRKPGFVMSNEHRVKIQNSNILNALIEHIEGEREMSATQVSAGLGLLKKVLPDLAASADAGDNGQLSSVTQEQQKAALDEYVRSRSSSIPRIPASHPRLPN